MKKVFVTGAAGFIGSHLVDQLLGRGVQVVGWDNLSTGCIEFLESASKHSKFQFIEGDNLDFEKLKRAMRDADTVFHLAANADVRFGTHHPRKDLEQNTIATFNVLEAMRLNGASRIVFPSTGSVYGEAQVFPTPENAPFPIQTSLYAASKLAGEGMISAFCEGFGIEGYCFRFVSVLGERYSHGHILDFYKQLLEHPQALNVLGNGTQRKSYMYVGDCVGGMLHVLDKNVARDSKHKFVVYNLGTNEYCQVNDSIKWICDELGLSPLKNYSGGDRGWVGDNPFIFLDIGKLMQDGFAPKVKIESGVRLTLRWLKNNHWIFKKRKTP